MSYYDELQEIAHVDKHDTILRSVEKWEAHKKGLLHRAITISFFYNDYAILQHRKHPVFDNVFDLSASSHQLMKNGVIETDEATLQRTLERELGLSQTDLAEEPVQDGVIYYKAQDPHSDFIEHEVCHIYTCRTMIPPKINLDFAYGYSLQKVEEIKNKKSPLYSILAPWVKEMIKKEII